MYKFVQFYSQGVTSRNPGGVELEKLDFNSLKLEQHENSQNFSRIRVHLLPKKTPKQNLLW